MKTGLNSDLFDQINQFDRDRNWLGLDRADLAKSIVLEAAELLECFQWENTLNKRGEGRMPDNSVLADETADIFIYLVKFCRESRIDLLEAVRNKLDKTASKYPVNYRDNGGHDEYLRIKKKYRQTNTK